MDAPRSIGIAGTGNIACGLAVACAPHLAVQLHARSEDSACRAEQTIARMARSAPVGVTIEHQVPLVELAFAREAGDATRATLRALCTALDKTVIEVPDVPGFVVNRIVFPMLLAAVETLELTGLAPEAVDDAMRLALGHPLGPLRTLDFIGIDVALAIAQRLELRVPATLREMAAAGALGRKTRGGFYAYSTPPTPEILPIG